MGIEDATTEISEVQEFIDNIRYLVENDYSDWQRAVINILRDYDVLENPLQKLLEDAEELKNFVMSKGRYGEIIFASSEIPIMNPPQITEIFNLKLDPRNADKIQKNWNYQVFNLFDYDSNTLNFFKTKVIGYFLKNKGFGDLQKLDIKNKPGQGTLFSQGRLDQLNASRKETVEALSDIDFTIFTSYSFPGHRPQSKPITTKITVLYEEKFENQQTTPELLVSFLRFLDDNFEDIISFVASYYQNKLTDLKEQYIEVIQNKIKNPITDADPRLQPETDQPYRYNPVYGYGPVKQQDLPDNIRESKKTNIRRGLKR